MEAIEQRTTENDEEKEKENNLGSSQDSWFNQYQRDMQEPVSTPATIPKLDPKPTVVTQPKVEPLIPKQEPIWCPYKEEWINPVKCGQCQTLRFNIYKSCRERRAQNPNDPIFQPSKPKPISAYT